MTRQLLLYCVGCSLLALSATAAADDLPTRKAGLWEIKTVRTGSPIPEMTLQHCTDDTTDHDMNDMVAPAAKQVCSKRELKKTATGYVSDAVCNVAGMSVTSHADIVGDFNSAYTVTSNAHSEGGPAGVRDTVTKIEAKWVGACKEGQKPGDIVMPGGYKLNVKDMQKLKSLLPAPKAN
jgi:hypothetical protein